MNERKFFSTQPDQTSSAENAEVPAADLEALYRNHYDNLYFQLRQLGVPSQEVNDFLQEGFARTHKYLRKNQFDGNQKALGKFVRLSSYHAYLDSRRRDDKITITPESDFDFVSTLTYESGYSDAESRVDVANLLRQLDPKQAQVLYMLYCADMGQEEVADALGIRHGTVKSRSSRGIQKLRKELRLDQE